MTDKQPTRRQRDVLINLYLGDQVADGKRVLKWEELGTEPVDVPAWGLPARFGNWNSNMGGAVRRMKVRLGEDGWLEYRINQFGNVYGLNKLTLKALEWLKLTFPELPDIDKKVADQRAAEDQAKVDQAIQKQANEAARLKRRAKRKNERRTRMEAVLRDFQVQHSLTDDQLVDMWTRIADEEVMKIN